MSLIDELDPEKSYVLKGATLKEILQMLKKVEPWGEVEAHGLAVAVGEKKVTIRLEESAGGGGFGSWRMVPGTLTVSGLSPSSTEIGSALNGAYTASGLTPQEGDVVPLLFSGQVRFFFFVSLTPTTGSTQIFDRSFGVGGVTYYAFGWQAGLW